MFDHVVVSTGNYEQSKAFYLKALRPLGVTVLSESPLGIELSTDGRASLCIRRAEAAPSHLHLAFEAASREQVDAFYREALASGATDNGPPGLRPQYTGIYYAAFIIGPDGHNIEAVFHEDEAVALPNSNGLPPEQSTVIETMQNTLSLLICMTDNDFERVSELLAIDQADSSTNMLFGGVCTLHGDPELDIEHATKKLLNRMTLSREAWGAMNPTYRLELICRTQGDNAPNAPIFPSSLLGELAWRNITLKLEVGGQPEKG